MMTGRKTAKYANCCPLGMLRGGIGLGLTDQEYKLRANHQKTMIRCTLRAAEKLGC